MSVLNIKFLEEENLFENLQSNKTISFNEPDPNTVITRDLKNKDLSYFKDNIWDFTSYASNSKNIFIILKKY